MASDVLVRHPATEAANAIDAALTDLAHANLWSMRADELAQLVIALERAARKLDAARVDVTAQADASLVAQREGATSLAAWLKAVADVPISTTKGRLRLHEALQARPRAAAAFTAGDITTDAATAICEAIDKLPAAVPAALVGEVEQLLVETAREEGTRAVMHQATQITHRFAPDQLERAEAAQAEATRLKLSLRHDGSVTLRGLLDKEAGALAFAVLGPLAAPAPATGGTADTRDTETRYGAAFVQVLRLATGAKPGTRGESAQLLVSIGLEALQNQMASAPGLLLDTATPISAGAARRLACDATVIPVVLGAQSEPVDIGRATRVVPTGLRRAVIARDQGCAMPGCDRPPNWCDVHHCRHWADGGETALGNCCLLCERHHTVIHHHGWTIEIRNGLPWFIPPRWLDPSQSPRLHHRYKTRKLRL